MTDYEKDIHKAAAIAQKATGVPIITHTEGPTGGPEQAQFLLSHGADPKKVMIGHVSNSKEISYLKAILAQGVSIGFDRLGLSIMYGIPDEIHVRNIAILCKEGYASKIMLSHDTVSFWLGRPLDVPEKALELFKDWRLDHVSRDIVPALKQSGVSDGQIKTMMVDNPRNLFAGKG